MRRRQQSKNFTVVKFFSRLWSKSRQFWPPSWRREGQTVNPSATLSGSYWTFKTKISYFWRPLRNNLADANRALRRLGEQGEETEILRLFLESFRDDFLSSLEH